MLSGNSGPAKISGGPSSQSACENRFPLGVYWLLYPSPTNSCGGVFGVHDVLADAGSGSVDWSKFIIFMSFLDKHCLISVSAGTDSGSISASLAFIADDVSPIRRAIEWGEPDSSMMTSPRRPAASDRPNFRSSATSCVPLLLLVHAVLILAETSSTAIPVLTDCCHSLCVFMALGRSVPLGRV